MITWHFLPFTFAVNESLNLSIINLFSPLSRKLEQASQLALDSLKHPLIIKTTTNYNIVI